MSLSAEELDGVIEGLITAAGHEGGLRRTPRVSLRGAATAFPVQGDAAGGFAIKVRDVSRGGLGFTLDRAIAVGTPLTVGLPLPADAEPLRLTCHVRHCRQVRPGLYAVGAAFENPLTEEEQEE